MRTYLYVVDRDFGFAPNPFFGYCTLATCKPKLRRKASVGDWVIGVGGKRLNATGKCLFAMQVTEALTFDQYWEDARFLVKRPVRNGSRARMVGDNIYHRIGGGEWMQEDSHHSHVDGTVNELNRTKDTSTNRVLVSKKFCYFGVSAPRIPVGLLNNLGYSNRQGYRVYDEQVARPLLRWVDRKVGSAYNQIRGDPFDFKSSSRRYTGVSSRVQ